MNNTQLNALFVALFAVAMAALGDRDWAISLIITSSITLLLGNILALMEKGRAKS